MGFVAPQHVTSSWTTPPGVGGAQADQPVSRPTTRGRGAQADQPTTTTHQGRGLQSLVSAFEEREDGEPGTPHPGTCPCRVGGTPGTRGGQADTALSTPARHAQAGGCGARVALGGQPVLEAHAENGLCEQDSGWPETRKGQHQREEAQGSQRGSTRLPRPSTRSGSMGQSRGGGRTRKQGTGWAHTSPRPQPPPGSHTRWSLY